MSEVTDAREQMVRTQIEARGMPPELLEFAYQDSPLPIEQGQTISQPYIVALMTAALELRPNDTVAGASVRGMKATEVT